MTFLQPDLFITLQYMFQMQNDTDMLCYIELRPTSTGLDGRQYSVLTQIPGPVTPDIVKLRSSK